MRATYIMIAVGLAACGPSSKPSVDGTAPPEPSTHDRSARQLDATYGQILRMWPSTGVGLGYHDEYDGKLPEVGRVELERKLGVLRGAIEQLESIERQDLDDTQVIERDVLLAKMRALVFSWDVNAEPYRSPQFYVWALGLSAYVSRDYAPVEVRARGVIGISLGAPHFIDQAIANLASPMPRTWVDTALMQTRGLIAFASEDVVRELSGLDAATDAELNDALEKYRAALTIYAEFLEAARESATDDFALGEAKFLQMLSELEGLETDMATLRDIAARDQKRNTDAAMAAAREIDPDADPRTVIDGVKNEKPPIDGVLAEAIRQTDAMRTFLVDNDIVTIPSDHVAEIRDTPAFMRFNFAFLSSPGPFETKALPAFYYITPSDPSWPIEEQQAYVPSFGDLLFTSIHEVWPGHFLHGLHKKTVEAAILKSFCTYSMSEGWAHYTEEMMWEAGVGGGDPRVHIGQLGDALLRNARFTSALGLHTQNMTVDESIAVFRTVAFSDPVTARQQAVRGTFDPGYLNYTLGKLMIKKLRDDYEAHAGDAYTLRSFHDAFLSYGCAPIPVIRRAMLGDDAGPAL